MMRAQHYSAVVEKHFTRPQHAGPLSGDYEAVLNAAAGQREQGTEVVFHIGITTGRIAAITFQAFGCPHTIAACSVLTERLTGLPVAALDDVKWTELVASLDLPVEKTGRMLIIEDALRKCRAAWDNKRLGR
ncbi:MAG TPA: iron-sulfur cluster assembly scaffold protein [Gammaproteobacteria bacterium]|jgi:NifU-like protein involved in Fe-S cluster formation|nr:iron-sulfur cluster assembly scaffold protein [Gammaproteobacteria bacterium]MDP7153692.1 iron-sulfur cluster assembly scaffold protein [Gammaproteobacteria bacterium]MDP7660695.1 iron-sulfur cluster assembly scaffold protein [Gammaproteobacteria bacterium]HJP39051.1 iron-sulfur cluster assembly scaffold protein [Gammaproteobacteria bacterium]